uniref:ATP synthase complex subunit 8 n=2 Tax=Peprilus TaxID=183652 RepID=A0A1Q2TBG3_9SCOM|nr:ATP synthase F0 subunit 8 [Peprilus triacanthus]WNH18803.1 ATP synthase F0 subunit 8 [Peprilus burti]WNH37183.1 ATP synthase F0 subunit 8 [Peprilus triacanthus]BAN83676.1 ATPase subunit 8 [Peprilus triacanthus]BAW88968.1 ATPase subunit 8 [Peprilus burti]
MPQLNPGPWLAILLFSWSIFLIIVTPKVMAHTFPNMPTLQSTKKPKGESWDWPWH